jgi:hypothetical protein
LAGLEERPVLTGPAAVSRRQAGHTVNNECIRPGKGHAISMTASRAPWAASPCGRNPRCARPLLEAIHGSPAICFARPRHRSTAQPSDDRAGNEATQAARELGAPCNRVRRPPRTVFRGSPACSRESPRAPKRIGGRGSSP